MGPEETRGDPEEGLAPDGTIRTGAARHRIPATFRPVLDAAVARIVADAPEAAVYVYGSVATGMAQPPASDVDLLTVGLGADEADSIADTLSAEFVDRCRAVEIAASTPADLEGPGDEAYGGRVFLHHYCVHLAGPDLDRATAGYPGDRRAARGFNGDIGRHARAWREGLATSDPVTLGRRVARKTLLAVAGLVSIHDSTWTTDRTSAQRRWEQVHPELAPGLAELSGWASSRTVADRDALARLLDEVVDPVVRQFAHEIGRWSDLPG